MKNELQKLHDFVAESLALSRVRDLDVLLERLLGAARRLSNADAGSIYIRDEENPSLLHFSHTQNATLSKRLPPGRKLPFAAFTVPIGPGSIAGFVAATGSTLNLPDVHRLPPDATYSFDSSFDRDNNYVTQSMLTFPLTHRAAGEDEQDEVVGVLQLINARDEQGRVVAFPEEDAHLMHLFADYAANAITQAQMIRSMILGMIAVAELRDPTETGPHVKRVGAYAAEIYEAWAVRRGLSGKTIDKNRDILRLTAMLHDVGKVAIEDSILKKPGKLTAEERTRMEEHTTLGAQLLLREARSKYHAAAAEIALNHHERWDGAGYPSRTAPRAAGTAEPDRATGKKGDEIPLFARIVAVADVFDALSSNRSYKKAWTEQDVVEEMKKSSGTHFDPDIIQAFGDCLETLHAIRQRYPDKTE